MWTVGSKNTMIVNQNPEANFPISLELRFHSMPKREGSWGMWFSVGDAWYLVRQLLKAIAKQKAAEYRVHWIGLRARIGQVDGAKCYRPKCNKLAGDTGYCNEHAPF